MATVIVSPAAERFELEEKRAAKRPYTRNNRANQIHQLRQEMRNLRRRIKVATEEERGPLIELRNILQRKLVTLRRPEWHWRRRTERSRAFLAKPFRFTKRLLGQKRSSQLTCRHLRDTLRNEDRDQDLGHCKTLISPPQPTVEFDSKEPSWKEVQEVFKKARTSSAPGWRGVPYRFYKTFPRLLHRMEDPECDLEEEQCSPPVQVCRRGVDSKGGRIKEH